MSRKFDASQDVTARLKFKPDATVDNGLCRGTLINVEVTEAEVKSDSEWIFAGMTVPTLNFRFQNIPSKVDNHERFYTQRETIIANNMEEKVEDNLYDAMFKRITHIYNAFSKSPNFRKLTELTVDCDRKSSPEEVIKAFKAFFEKVAKEFNGDGKKTNPVYKDKDGKFIPVWMKLIANYPEHRAYVFPNFVGEGFIEPIISGVSPSIEIKVQSGETIILRGKGAKQGIVGSGDQPSADSLPDDVKAKLGL